MAAVMTYFRGLERVLAGLTQSIPMVIPSLNSCFRLVLV